MADNGKNTPKKGFFRNLLDKYDAFLAEVGMDAGKCKSCVPIVKQDENGNKVKDK